MTTTTNVEQPATQVQEPNLFELQGDGATITYSTTSIAGVPQFNYQDNEHSVNRSGDEIRVEQTEIARLVTVDIEQVPDAYDLSVSLLVPIINLRGQTGEASVQTVAVLTTDRSSAFTGPGGVEGQVQTYETLSLQGTARRVAF
jgi:hypothetical protein